MSPLIIVNNMRAHMKGLVELTFNPVASSLCLYCFGDLFNHTCSFFILLGCTSHFAKADFPGDSVLPKAVKLIVAAGKKTV